MLSLLQITTLAEGDSSLTFMLMIPALLLVMWAMGRPQKKREEERKAALEALKKGDKVFTIGGIHGEIKNISERYITIVVDNKGTELKMSKAAISGKVDNSTPAA